MNIEDRVKYYIGNLKTQKWEITFDTNTEECSFKKDDKDCVYRDIYPNNYGVYAINNNMTSELYKKLVIEKGKKLDIIDQTYTWVDKIADYNAIGYIEPIIKLYKSEEYFEKENHNFLIRPGDIYYNFDCPIISKTRPVGESYNILINLDGARHWDTINVVKKEDISFSEKNDKLIWRGASNGFVYSTERPSRLTICKKYFDNNNKNIDIGFSSNSLGDEYNYLIKGNCPIEEQLKSKFLISLEGGDVATNLKWMLYSNSVVLMPEPTMVSWLMEDKLRPWVHYVPLSKDFVDLEEKYEWCKLNMEKCEEIALNGKMYIEQFLDKERENKITSLVLKEYTNNVSNIIVNNYTNI